MRKAFFAVLATLLVSSYTSAQQQLSSHHFFKDDFSGIIVPLPKPGSWQDNQHFTFTRNNQEIVIDANTGKEQVSGYAIPIPTKDIKVKVVSKNNDLFIDGNPSRQLTSDSVPEVNPTVSPDQTKVAYTHNNNLYYYDLNLNKTVRLTNDGSDVILNGYASWVYMEEILGRASRYKAFWWSPDSRYIAFMRFNDAPVPVFTITDAHKRSGYVETIRYPKAGDPNPEVRIGIADIQTNTVRWADFNEKDDQYFGEPFWLDDGRLLVQWMNRDQNKLEVYQINKTTGAKTLFYEEDSQTWINLEDKRFAGIPGKNEVIIKSARSGYNQLYLHNKNGKRINTITPDGIMVTNIVAVHPGKNILIFTGKKQSNPAQVQVFSVSLNGKHFLQISPDGFNYSNITVSPEFTSFVMTRETARSPKEMILINPSGKVFVLASSKGAEFDQYKLSLPEFFTVKSSDGLFDLPVRVIWPANLEPGKKYPVMFSIYGGPERQDVSDTWSLSGTEQWFAQEGLIQVVADHRGSAYFGRRGSPYIYKQLGIREISDYTDVVKWLVTNGNADPKKIAIRGFSYGGYLSALAVTLGAPHFTHAYAGGSVTDWLYYDTHYTERYMGTPQNNPDGYRRSSVLTYTTKYEGLLHLTHGVTDENVHLQNTLALAADLQDKKKYFEMMLYPNARHGYRGTKGQHHSNLRNIFIYKNLLEKPVPPELLK